MSKSMLSEEARAAKARYQKKWREKNKDKQRLYMARYWERRAQRENLLTE